MILVLIVAVHSCLLFILKSVNFNYQGLYSIFNLEFIFLFVLFLAYFPWNSAFSRSETTNRHCPHLCQFISNLTIPAFLKLKKSVSTISQSEPTSFLFHLVAKTKNPNFSKQCSISSTVGNSSEQKLWSRWKTHPRCTLSSQSRLNRIACFHRNKNQIVFQRRTRRRNSK